MDMKQRVFISACVAILLFGMTITTLGSVLPELQERFHLSQADAGTIFSILPFGLLAGSLLFGPLSDRFGYQLTLTGALVCMFLGFEGIVVVPSRALLYVTVFLFGAGGGAINGTTSALVSELSTNKKAGLSILGVFFSLGALGMPFLLGLLENSLRWQQILSATGLLTLALAIGNLFLSFPTPAAPIPFSPSRVGHMLRSRQLLLIGFFLFFQSALEGIINNWTPTLLMGRLQLDNRAALYALTLSVTGMAVMRLGIGSVLRNVSPWSLLALSSFMLMAGYLLLGFATDFLTATGGLVLIGGGLAAGFPVMLGIVGSLFTHLSATAFSIVLAIALIGNMIINYLLGLFVDAFGMLQIILFGVYCTVALILLSFVIRRKTR